MKHLFAVVSRAADSLKQELRQAEHWSPGLKTVLPLLTRNGTVIAGLL